MHPGAKPEDRGYAIPGREFKRLVIDRCVLYLRGDLIDYADTIAAAVSHEPSGETGAGNRHSGFSMKLDNGIELFVRYSRRGGLMRYLTRGLFLGVSARPVQELAVTAEARNRGIPVAEPLGAAVRWLLPALHRSAFLTRMLHGMTLWEFMQTDDDPTVRKHVVEEARVAISSAHQKGLYHADLNLHNIFVSSAGESFSVILIDLDKARIYGSSLTPALRVKNLTRLRRSLKKLDPMGLYFSEASVKALTTP